MDMPEDKIQRQEDDMSLQAPTMPRSDVNIAEQVKDTIAPLRILIKSSGIYALSSIALPLISLVLVPFLTHALSATDYGILTILNTFIGLIAGITQLGLGSAFFRAYAYDYTAPEDRASALGTVILLLFLVSLVMMVGVFLTAPLLANFLFERPLLGQLIVLTAGAVFIQNLTVPCFAWLRVESRALLYSIVSIGSSLLTLLTNIILVSVLHLGLTGALLAIICGYAFVVICMMPFVLLRASFRLRTDIVRNVLSFGLPLVPSFLSIWVLQLSDRYLLSIFSSLSETARYGVSYTLGSALSIIVMGPFNLAWPTAMFAIAKREDALQIFKLIFRWFSLFLLFAAFGLSLVGTFVLHWLFPATYQSVANIIPIVAGSVVFYGTYYLFGVGLAIKRKTWLGVIFTTIAALVNVALNLILIPFSGATGAAVSTLIAYIILAFVCYIVTRRLYPIPFEIGLFLIAVLMGGVIYIGSGLLGRRFETYGAWCISFGGLLLYGGCLVLLGMFPSWRRKHAFR